jgi:MinD-like ATPase involved in chromosome partitioning or flagellar assembly
MCRILAFTSAITPSGKTAIAINTAMALAQNGRTVTLLEVDRAAAGILGLQDYCTLKDYLLGCCSEEELVIPYMSNLNIVLTGEPIIPVEDRMTRLSGLSEMIEARDYLIIDAPKGSSDKLETIAEAAWDVFVVVTPEQVANTDAIAYVQEFNRRAPEKQPYLILNRAPFPEMAEIICNRIEHDFTQILGFPVVCIAFVPQEASAPEAQGADSRRECGFRELACSSEIARLASTIDEAHRERREDNAIHVESLLRKLMSVLPGGRRTLLLEPDDECGQGYPDAPRDEVELFREIILDALDSSDPASLDFNNLYIMVRQIIETSRAHEHETAYFPAPRF